jgi:hypothetical protein
MASQPTFEPQKHASQLGSPYCSDPDCQSCKELREAQEAISQHQPVRSRSQHERVVLLAEKLAGRIFG